MPGIPRAALKEQIESMTVTHQVEVLRTLRDEGVTMNENSNGTFVNMTSLEEVVVEKLAGYVRYVEDQQTRLSTVEAEKERLHQEFFNGAKNSVINTGTPDVCAARPAHAL